MSDRRRVVAVIGNCLRHFYIAHCIAAGAELCGLVVETREEFIPEPPTSLAENLKSLFRQHFRGRAEAEDLFFSKYAELPPCETLRVEKHDLNSSQTVEFIAGRGADVAISYGVHKLSSTTLNRLPSDRWNIHGGLSPQYRGVITHFWPSYQLEPQMTGVTLHVLTGELDGGPIIHQTAAPLVRGDGVHELACRTVEMFGLELTKVLRAHADGALSPPIPQKTAGKLWLGTDWRPEHLTVIYSLHGNRIVDAYLDGALTERAPLLVRQPIDTSL